MKKIFFAFQTETYTPCIYVLPGVSFIGFVRTLRDPGMLHCEQLLVIF